MGTSFNQPLASNKDFSLSGSIIDNALTTTPSTLSDDDEFLLRGRIVSPNQIFSKHNNIYSDITPFNIFVSTGKKLIITFTNPKSHNKNNAFHGLELPTFAVPNSNNGADARAGVADAPAELREAQSA